MLESKIQTLGCYHLSCDVPSILGRTVNQNYYHAIDVFNGNKP
jgi:hypothetical protein